MDCAVTTDGGAPPAPWYCVRAQPRREALAAAALPTLKGVNVFHPRVHYMRPTRLGIRRNTVSLFPGYLFARFHLDLLKQVTYTQGVARVIRRGLDAVEVPPIVINELFLLTSGGSVNLGTPKFRIGQKIRVIAGIFCGTESTIVRLAPARKRVAILLELLGQTQEVTLGLDHIDILDPDPRHRICW
ncbi:MAG: hypothetical protein LBD01_05355 [Puniceicoccales bacterium]|jgi:transcriptional antiterminator RfaH|nr:hypothetical protein [Puniceicoccales bacterium]